MLTRKSTSSSRTSLTKALAGATGGALDRRAFLRRSGLAAGGLAAASSFSLGTVKKADAQAAAAATGQVKLVKNVCTHCSVGCTVTAEVVNGVWTSQEPTFESPINLGGHCAKGAAIREVCVGERRLKYPMKLEGGRWQR